MYHHGGPSSPMTIHLRSLTTTGAKGSEGGDSTQAPGDPTQ